MEVGFRFESTSACMLEEGRESMMEVGGETWQGNNRDEELT
jgi:hypothetical protein